MKYNAHRNIFDKLISLSQRGYLCDENKIAFCFDKVFFYWTSKWAISVEKCVFFRLKSAKRGGFKLGYEHGICFDRERWAGMPSDNKPLLELAMTRICDVIWRDLTKMSQDVQIGDLELVLWKFASVLFVVSFLENNFEQRYFCKFCVEYIASSGNILWMYVTIHEPQFSLKFVSHITLF